MMLSLSQEKLADALGLTFQQVQKYERGINRVGASRLYDLARILDVGVSYFFEDLPSETEESAPANGDDTAQRGRYAELVSRRETIDLVRAYYRISDPAIRRRMFELMRSMNPIETDTISETSAPNGVL